MAKEMFNYDEYQNFALQARNEITSGANKASSIASDTRDLNIDVLTNAAAAAKSALSPYAAAGRKAGGRLQDLLGLNGDERQAAATKSILSSPQVRQQLAVGKNLVESSAAAKGTLGTGRFLSELFTEGQGRATSEIARNQNLLLGLFQSGMPAAQGIAQVEQNLGTGIAGQNQFAGETAANSALAIGNANAAFSNQMGQISVQKQLDKYFLQGLALSGSAPQAPSLGGQQPLPNSGVAQGPVGRSGGTINYGNGVSGTAPIQGFARAFGEAHPNDPRSNEEIFGGLV